MQQSPSLSPSLSLSLSLALSPLSRARIHLRLEEFKQKSRAYTKWYQPTVELSLPQIKNNLHLTHLKMKHAWELETTAV